MQTNNLFTGTKDRIDECHVMIREFEQRLHESEVKKQQVDKDVRVVVRIQQFQSNQQQHLEEENRNSQILIKGGV